MSSVGFPRHLCTIMQNVSPLDLSSPIAQELRALEEEGIEVFDAFLQEVVFSCCPTHLYCL